MANITAHNEMAATFTVEFDHKLYFRVEILRVDTGEQIQPTTYFAEVYQLRLTFGILAKPHNRDDGRFRQSWLFLEDFPLVSGASVGAVRSEALKVLPAYADAYYTDYDPTVKRSQPEH